MKTVVHATAQSLPPESIEDDAYIQRSWTQWADSMGSKVIQHSVDTRLVNLWLSLFIFV